MSQHIDIDDSMTARTVTFAWNRSHYPRAIVTGSFVNWRGHTYHVTAVRVDPLSAEQALSPVYVDATFVGEVLPPRAATGPEAAR